MRRTVLHSAVLPVVHVHRQSVVLSCRVVVQSLSRVSVCLSLWCQLCVVLYCIVFLFRSVLYVGLHRPRGHDPSDAHVGSLSADSFSAIVCSVTNALGGDVHFIPKVKDSWK